MNIADLLLLRLSILLDNCQAYWDTLEWGTQAFVYLGLAIGVCWLVSKVDSAW